MTNQKHFKAPFENLTPIPGYLEYFANEYGEIFSYKKENFRSEKYRLKKLTGSINGNGYLQYGVMINKKRCNAGVADAMKRFIESKQANGETVKLKRNGKLRGSEVHHIDHCRSNGHKDNIFICESTQQHAELHNQTFQFIIECIQSGLLGFDWKNKKYFVAFKPVVDWIQSWRTEGRPMRHFKKASRGGPVGRDKTEGISSDVGSNPTLGNILNLANSIGLKEKP